MQLASFQKQGGKRDTPDTHQSIVQLILFTSISSLQEAFAEVSAGCWIDFNLVLLLVQQVVPGCCALNMQCNNQACNHLHFNLLDSA